jgi:hypothetical protein
MRDHWRLLGAAGFTGFALIFAFSVGHSRVSRADPAPTQTPSGSILPQHDPGTKYDLPDSIPFDQLSAADKAGVDSIQQTIELGQPPASFNVYAGGAAAAATDAQAQIAARSVGLEGTANDGVMP